MDYYSILKVPSNANLDAIKRAYRARAMECHPDRGGSHQAMLEINEAFEILRNSELRQRYDEARRDEFNAYAQQRAQADAAHARQEAENYPRDWNQFKSWLDSLAEDFANAKYGESGIWLSVDNSSSGDLFWLVGAVAGIALAVYCSSNYHVRGYSLVLCVAAGIAAGVWVHRIIGGCIKSGKTGPTNPQENSSDRSSEAQDEVVNCPQCGQSLRCPSGQPRARLRCPKCKFEFWPHGQAQAPAPQAGTKTAEDKATSYAVVTAIISGIFFYNSCSTKTPGDFFTSATTEPDWPPIVIGTIICAAIAYSIGKQPSGPKSPPTK
jgi:ssDNA-binding Zn-finger/Zn-ribbon topoisomerase 1